MRIALINTTTSLIVSDIRSSLKLVQKLYRQEPCCRRETTRCQCKLT